MSVPFAARIGAQILIVVVLAMVSNGSDNVSNGPELDTGTAGSSQLGRPAPVMILPIYNDRGLAAIGTHIEPHLASRDIFMIVSGNQDKDFDPKWVNATAARLHAAYPDTRLVTATSGITNVRAAASGVVSPIEGIVYIYEPAFANEPEFRWDIAEAELAIASAMAVIDAADMLAIVAPTGIPLDSNVTLTEPWDYVALAPSADHLWVQTQRYCRAGRQSFERAVTRLVSQGAVRGGWAVQVTVDPGSTNGVPAEQALDCARFALETGVDAIVMWWSPASPLSAAAFLRALRP